MMCASYHRSQQWQLTSTAARNDPAHITALGYGPSNSVWKIKYTYSGDTDFNGTVNFDDYSRIDSGFNNGGNEWFEGDFDFNGIVNFDDYSLIDLAFNTQGSLRVIPVPEPGLAAGLMLGALLQLRRRGMRRVRRNRASFKS